MNAGFKSKILSARAAKSESYLTRSKCTCIRGIGQVSISNADTQKNIDNLYFYQKDIIKKNNNLPENYEWLTEYVEQNM